MEGAQRIRSPTSSIM